MVTVLDLFCGAAAGWSLGLHRAGIRTVAACEIDPWRRAAFLAHFPDVRMYEDVRELTAGRLLADLGCLPDIVVGSPPCQEISAANSQGTGIADDHLFWDWARLVFEIRPRWCAAENSPRARSSGVDGILDALDQAGYAAWPSVVGADHAGANHRRRRLWLIAADAERLELWEQPGRSGGTNGRVAALAGEPNPAADRKCRQAGIDPQGREGGSRSEGNDPDANGRIASGTRRHADGCLAMGAGPDGDSSRHAARKRCGQGRPEPAQQRRLDDAGASGDAADPDRAGHPIGLRQSRDDGAELPAALRDIGRAWPDWNVGLAGLAASCAAAGAGRVDDGLPAGLAPGERNKRIAAYGDAVLPQITEAIGRAMMRLIA